MISCSASILNQSINLSVMNTYILIGDRKRSSSYLTCRDQQIRVNKTDETKGVRFPVKNNHEKGKIAALYHSKVSIKITP